MEEKLSGRSVISIGASTVTTESGETPLTPGMTASAEIKTGARPIIDFLLSPMKRYRDESLRER